MEGYQTAKLTFSYQKALEEVSLNAPAEPIALGEAVVITCNGHHSGDTCDFFASITSVKLTGPNEQERSVLPEGQEGTGYGYSFNGTTLTLGKNLFTESWANVAGTYTLTLSAAYGYEKQTVTFTMKEKEETPEPTAKEPPTVQEITHQTGYDEYYRVSFRDNDDDVSAYLNAVTSATLNGDLCEKTSFLDDDVKGFKIGIGSQGAAYLDFSVACFPSGEEVAVTVSATGYEDLTFTVGSDGNLVTDSTDPDPGPEEPSISVPTTAPSIEKKTNSSGNTYYELKFDEADQAWVSKISRIVRNSTAEYSFEDSLDDIGIGNTCYLDKEENVVAMAFPSDLSAATYTIVISSDQSADLTLEVTIPGLFGGALSVTIKTADS